MVLVKFKIKYPNKINAIFIVIKIEEQDFLNVSVNNSYIILAYLPHIWHDAKTI